MIGAKWYVLVGVRMANTAQISVAANVMPGARIDRGTPFVGASAMDEVWRLLGDERVHADRLIVGCEQGVKHSSLEENPLT